MTYYTETKSIESMQLTYVIEKTIVYSSRGWTGTFAFVRKLVALVAGNSEHSNKKGSTDEDENDPEKDPHDGHYSSSHFCLLATLKKVASPR